MLGMKQARRKREGPEQAEMACAEDAPRDTIRSYRQKGFWRLRGEQLSCAQRGILLPPGSRSQADAQPHLSRTSAHRIPAHHSWGFRDIFNLQLCMKRAQCNVCSLAVEV